MCEMRLDQFLDTQSADQLLFIGSASGFFFIGTPKEFHECRDAVEEKIKKRFRYSATESGRELRKLMSPVEVKEDPDKYAAELESRARKIRDMNEKFNRLNDRLLNFQPLNERIVRDYYQKAYGGIAVIVDGQEDGRYWTKEEWDDAHKND